MFQQLTPGQRAVLEGLPSLPGRGRLCAGVCLVAVRRLAGRGLAERVGEPEPGGERFALSESGERALGRRPIRRVNRLACGDVAAPA